MTTNYRRDWFNDSSIYYKAPYHDPLGGRTTSSTIETINHFSKPYKLIRYPNPDGYQDDGIAKQGKPEEVTFWCFIRSVWAGKKEEAVDTYDTAGIKTKGYMSVYYNPYHPKHPREGIHLHLSKPRSMDTMDYSGFADIIEYNGLQWRITSHNAYNVSYDEGVAYMGKALMERYTNDIIKKSNVDTTTSQHFIYKIK